MVRIVYLCVAKYIEEMVGYEEWEMNNEYDTKDDLIGEIKTFCN